MVVETTGPLLYVGRFDREDQEGVYLIGASIFDPGATDQTREDFLARTVKFGVRVDRPHLIVPPGAIKGITPLGAFNPH